MIDDDHDYIARDEGVFINTNQQDLKLYQQNRVRALKERAMQQQIDKLEREIVLIKQLLQKHLVRKQ